MKILFVHQGLQPFVKKDLDILQETHEVRCIELKGSFVDIAGNIIHLWAGVVWCDLTFSWFGKLHAFFAVLFSKMLRKKSIVIAGGDDVARVPEIKYGMFCFWWKRWCPLFVFRCADLVIPVSRFTEKETLVNAMADPKKVMMIYHGFSNSIFTRAANIKELLVVTIGTISNETNIRKGLRLFVEAAKLLPNVKFIVIGSYKDDGIDELRRICSDNLTFLGEVCLQDLITICGRAQVYVQASVHEGFGCSLAEAMLCECIPVVSRNGAIPEVAGDAGLYLDDLTTEDLAENIRRALTMTEDAGKKARDRVVKNFPLAKRRQCLLEAVESLNA